MGNKTELPVHEFCVCSEVSAQICYSENKTLLIDTQHTISLCHCGTSTLKEPLPESFHRVKTVLVVPVLIANEILPDQNLEVLSLDTGYLKRAISGISDAPLRLALRRAEDRSEFCFL